MNHPSTDAAGPRPRAPGEKSERLALSIFIVLAIGMAALAYRHGLQAQASLERQTQEEIDRENAAFCERFGAGRGSASYGVCAARLADIRERHEKRLEARARGLF